MIISTFNIQNNSKNYSRSKSEEISEYILSNKIDIIGLQEVFLSSDVDLNNILKNYNIVGKYRFLFKSDINEKNPIISKYRIIKSKTYYLPSFPSKYQRIMTYALIDYNGKEISIYNTHLEVKSNKIKLKQLLKIYEIFKSDKRPKIIMGDFNMKIDNPLFISFMSLMEKLNLKRIPILEKTYKTSKDNKAIDHIFISSDFKLIDEKVIKSLNTSDHYPIIIDIKC